MKIKVDSEKCFGYGACAEHAPDIYVLNEDGENEMGTFDVCPGMEEQALAGARACPQQAISVLEE